MAITDLPKVQAPGDNASYDEALRFQNSMADALIKYGNQLVGVKRAAEGKNPDYIAAMKEADRAENSALYASKLGALDLRLDRQEITQAQRDVLAQQAKEAYLEKNREIFRGPYQDRVAAQLEQARLNVLPAYEALLSDAQLRVKHAQEQQQQAAASRSAGYLYEPVPYSQYRDQVLAKEREQFLASGLRSSWASHPTIKSFSAENTTRDFTSPLLYAKTYYEPSLLTTRPVPSLAPTPSPTPTSPLTPTPSPTPTTPTPTPFPPISVPTPVLPPPSALVPSEEPAVLPPYAPVVPPGNLTPQPLPSGPVAPPPIGGIPQPVIGYRPPVVQNVLPEYQTPTAPAARTTDQQQQTQVQYGPIGQGAVNSPNLLGNLFSATQQSMPFDYTANNPYLMNQQPQMEIQYGPIGQGAVGQTNLLQTLLSQQQQQQQNPTQVSLFGFDNPYLMKPFG